MRTRQEILEIIDKGQTININGVDYNRTNRHKVPSEADLAVGDEKKEKDATASIQSQIERLQADLQKLEAAKAARAEKEEAPKKNEGSEETSKKGGVITGDKAAPAKEESKPEAKESKSEAKK